MNDDRFDTVARMFAGNATRRQAVLSAAGGALALGLGRPRVFAQEPTVVVTPTFDPTQLGSTIPYDLTLLCLFPPRPSDVNVERPERVVRSSPDILFFSLDQAEAVRALNTQQIAALPGDTRFVGRKTVLQQPPPGGERNEIGRYIDNTTIFFPNEDSVDIDLYWQTYNDIYYPELEQRDLDIEGLPNGIFVEYGGTLTDGREYQLVSGVAQFDQFLILTTNVRYDGAPSVNEVKRVIGSLRDRLQQRDVNQGLLDVTATSPTLFDVGPFLESPDSQDIPDAWFSTPLFEDGAPNGYVTPMGGNELRGTAEGGNVLNQFEQTRFYPVPGSEHSLIQRYRPTMFDTEEAARAHFEQAVAQSGEQPDIRIFDITNPTSPVPMLIGQYDLPTRDDESLFYPVYDSLILNGQFVIGNQILGGISVEGTPGTEYRESIRDYGEAVTNYILLGLGVGPDFDPSAFQAIINSTLEVQGHCAENPGACSE